MKPNRFQFSDSIHSAVAACAMAVALIGICVGCGTTTTRVATEQLLMSDAVDDAIAQIDFRSLRDKKVFLDTLYLHSVKGVGFVNAEYIISSLRQHLTAAQALIQDSRETADIIVEPRVGALGTDGHEVVYGLPQSGSLTNAALMLSSSPIPPIPEISFGKSNAQTGIAKVIVFAYDQETRRPVWQSGVAKAESTSRNNWYLGAGPFQKGSIHEGTRFAGRDIPPPPDFEYLAQEAYSPFLRADDQNALTPEEPPATAIGYQEPYVFHDSTNLEIPAPLNPDQEDEVEQATHTEEDH